MDSPLTAERFDAVLFDLDGVLTDTASVHSRAWKTMFDEFLQSLADEEDAAFTPFTIDGDYMTWVDGKPRYDGVRSFLQSRDIELPEGGPDDDPEQRTVHGLGNRKNLLVNQLLTDEGVTPFEGSVALVRQLRERGVHRGVVSSSKNCATVLEAAGIADLFETRVDGVVAVERGLPGKPAPDTFLAAAADLGVAPDRAVVVEDALSGVQAGRAGAFGLVVGVDREGRPDALLEHGADIVVQDLAELLS